MQGLAACALHERTGLGCLGTPRAHRTCLLVSQQRWRFCTSLPRYSAHDSCLYNLPQGDPGKSLYQRRGRVLVTRTRSLYLPVPLWEQDLFQTHKGLGALSPCAR